MTGGHVINVHLSVVLFLERMTLCCGRYGVRRMYVYDNPYLQTGSVVLTSVLRDVGGIYLMIMVPRYRAAMYFIALRCLGGLPLVMNYIEFRRALSFLR